jgi:hypothetical protein
MGTNKGLTILAVMVATLIAYFVAIALWAYRCPRCHTRLGIFTTDPTGLVLSWFCKIKKPCPNCGLNFDEQWPPLTTVEEAVQTAEQWDEDRNPIK